MKAYYGDILSRIKETPLWFDEHGVPRYEPFRPDLVANIYAVEAALVRIHCQNCRYKFDVAFSSAERDKELLTDLVVRMALSYGDPPNVRCCPSGPTMTSDAKRVLQFWTSLERSGARPVHSVDPALPPARPARRWLGDWRRCPDLEILVED